MAGPRPRPRLSARTRPWCARVPHNRLRGRRNAVDVGTSRRSRLPPVPPYPRPRSPSPYLQPPPRPSNTRPRSPLPPAPSNSPHLPLPDPRPRPRPRPHSRSRSRSPSFVPLEPQALSLHPDRPGGAVDAFVRLRRAWEACPTPLFYPLPVKRTSFNTLSTGAPCGG